MNFKDCTYDELVRFKNANELDIDNAKKGIELNISHADMTNEDRIKNAEKDLIIIKDLLYKIDEFHADEHQCFSNSGDRCTCDDTNHIHCSECDMHFDVKYMS